MLFGGGAEKENKARVAHLTTEDPTYIFDDMLYLLEKEGTVGKTVLECMSVDAIMEMATRKKRQERWRSRRMPAGMHEVVSRMKALGIDTCDELADEIKKSNLSPAWKAPLLAFLFVWRSHASA